MPPPRRFDPQSSLGLGPGLLEPEEVAHPSGDRVVELSLPGELGARPQEEAHPADQQAPDLEGAEQAPGAFLEIDDRVEVELEPVVLLAEQDRAEAPRTAG